MKNNGADVDPDWNPIGDDDSSQDSVIKDVVAHTVAVSGYNNLKIRSSIPFICANYNFWLR